jgi:hypothetical protein
MKTRTIARCRCGRPLARFNRRGTCYACFARAERQALLRSHTADSNAPSPEQRDAPIRARRVPVYQARAQARQPLFDPPIPD